MRATIMYGAGDIRIASVPDADLIEASDALVAVRRAAICGSDLWPYKSMEPSEAGRCMGHEFIGVVEAVGAKVRSVKPGDFVAAPFLFSDGTCVFCQTGRLPGHERPGSDQSDGHVLAVGLDRLGLPVNRKDCFHVNLDAGRTRQDQCR